MQPQFNFKQELVGCFGFPVAENPTQAMVEPAFEALGLDWRYLTLEVRPEDLAAAVQGAAALGLRGFHCTIPHKVAVVQHMDRLAHSARLMGAVNCVVRREGQWVGENTDGKGFVTSFRKFADPSGKSMTLLGAGGAARAIAVEMALAGVSHITIVNRGEKRGELLCELLGNQVKDAVGGELSVEYVPWRGDYQIASNTHILVNATSIGLAPKGEARLPIDMTSLNPEMVVADVIPNPPRTRLVREAEQRGCRVIDGLEMLVAQGVIAIEYWTGKTPDTDVMRNSLQRIFAG